MSNKAINIVEFGSPEVKRDRTEPQVLWHGTNGFGPYKQIQGEKDTATSELPKTKPEVSKEPQPTIPPSPTADPEDWRSLAACNPDNFVNEYYVRLMHLAKDGDPVPANPDELFFAPSLEHSTDKPRREAPEEQRRRIKLAQAVCDLCPVRFECSLSLDEGYKASTEWTHVIAGKVVQAKNISR